MLRLELRPAVMFLIAVLTLLATNTASPDAEGAQLSSLAEPPAALPRPQR